MHQCTIESLVHAHKHWHLKCYDAVLKSLREVLLTIQAKDGVLLPTPAQFGLSNHLQKRRTKAFIKLKTNGFNFIQESLYFVVAEFWFCMLRRRKAANQTVACATFSLLASIV